MIKMKENSKNKVTRKLFQLISVLLIMLLFPSKINAAANKITITCDDKQLKSEQVLKCYIQGENFSYPVSSIHSALKLSNNIPITSIKKDSIWEGAVDNGIIDLYTDSNKSGNFNILDFEFKIPSTTNQITITLNEITLSDASFNSIPISEITKTIIINEETNQNNNNNDNNNQNNNNQNNNNNNNQNNNNQSVIDNPKTGTNYIVFGIIGGLISFAMLLILKRGK